MRRTGRILPWVWLIPISWVLAGQAADITGRWAGETVFMGSTDHDMITLAIEKNSDTYSGTISDSLGMIKNAPIESVRFENDNLRFKFTAVVGGREVKMRAALNLFTGRLIGAWATDEGTHAYGSLELERTK